MKITQLHTLAQYLREALNYVRCSTHESDGFAKGLVTKRIQTAQSLIGDELAKQPLKYEMFPYYEGATYLFVVDGEPLFTLDEWSAADTTYSSMFREMPGRVRVQVIVHNPADDDEISTVTTGKWFKRAAEKKLAALMQDFENDDVEEVDCIK